MTSYLIDLISPNIEDALGAHDMNDSPTWMCGMFVMPTPDGQAAMNGYLSVSIASPVIGDPSPTATAILDPTILQNKVECDRLVADLLGRAREMRSQQIAESRAAYESMSDKDFDFDFSSLKS